MFKVTFQPMPNICYVLTQIQCWVSVIKNPGLIFFLYKISLEIIGNSKFGDAPRSIAQREEFSTNESVCPSLAELHTTWVL